MEDYEKLAIVKKQIMALSSEEVKRRLADEFGYDSRYLYYIDPGREYNELIYSIMEHDPTVRTTYPHTYAGLPDGSSILPDGTVEVICCAALVIGHGYTPKEVSELEDPYEEWCKATKTPLDPKYVEKKERMLKRKAKQDEKNNIVRLNVKKFNR